MCHAGCQFADRRQLCRLNKLSLSSFEFIICLPQISFSFATLLNFFFKFFIGYQEFIRSFLYLPV